MAKMAEIQQFMQQMAPTELAADWDNVGVLVDCSKDITGILVSLDITEEVVSEAEEQGCQLIVSHHPVIFKPLSRLNRKNIAFQMIEKGISALCAHTNLDAADGGVNDVLAQLMGLQNAKPFGEGSMGRIGTVETTTVHQLAERCRDALKAGGVKMSDTGCPIHKLAIVTGSGGSMFREAIAEGADALLTGEASHHDALDAKQLGLSMVAAGHYSTEVPVVPVLADRLSRQFPDVRVLCSSCGHDPFTYL